MINLLVSFNNYFLYFQELRKCTNKICTNEIYHLFHPPHSTVFLPIWLLPTYVSFFIFIYLFFHNALSPVRAGHMCMSMGPSEFGKPTSGHYLWKKFFLFQQLSTASVKVELRDLLLHLCFDLGLAWSCEGNHSCFELMISIAVSCPEDSTVQHSSTNISVSFFCSICWALVVMRWI